MRHVRRSLPKLSLLIGWITTAAQYRRTLPLAIILLVPMFAHAERVSFDYSAFPKFEGIFISGSDPLVFEQDRWPKYIHTRFIIEGSSAEEWTEIFEMINTQRKNEPKDVRGWYDRFQTQGEKTCQSNWEILEESKESMMFEHRADDCQPFEAQHALYRVFYGKKNVFVLFATRKAGMDAETRDRWMKLLKSAEIKR